MVEYRSKKLWWLLLPTMDKLSKVSRCPYGRTVAILLSRVSFDAVRIAIILFSPLVWAELLNPDTLRYTSCEVYADSVLTQCEYSVHSPFIEIHGMLRNCVPMLTTLLINSYFSRWLGIDILCQNLSAVSVCSLSLCNKVSPFPDVLRDLCRFAGPVFWTCIRFLDVMPRSSNCILGGRHKFLLFDHFGPGGNLASWRQVCFVSRLRTSNMICLIFSAMLRQNCLLCFPRGVFCFVDGPGFCYWVEGQDFELPSCGLTNRCWYNCMIFWVSDLSLWAPIVSFVPWVLGLVGRVWLFWWYLFVERLDLGLSLMNPLLNSATPLIYPATA